MLWHIRNPWEGNGILKLIYTCNADTNEINYCEYCKKCFSCLDKVNFK